MPHLNLSSGGIWRSSRHEERNWPPIFTEGSRADQPLLFELPPQAQQVPSPSLRSRQNASDSAPPSEADKPIDGGLAEKHQNQTAHILSQDSGAGVRNDQF